LDLRLKIHGTYNKRVVWKLKYQSHLSTAARQTLFKTSSMKAPED